MSILPHKIRSPQNWREQPRLKNFLKNFKNFNLLFYFSLLASKIKTVMARTKYLFEYKKRTTLKKVFFYSLGIFLLIFLAFSITCVAAFAWFSRDLPNPDKILERSLTQSTKIYDRTGQILLYEIHGDQKRTVIELNQIPDYVKWATIVIEDKDFYNHHGFDLRGIIRALWVNIFRGGKIQGGSTITQQFIKNSILSPEKTYSRKIKELILAYQLEKKFSKDQILKMYLNEIPYGSTAYGIESAAQAYFGKSARDLDLAEAALLAALPKAPTYYSPYGNHKDELLNRYKYILDLMVEQGHLEKEKAEEAKNIDILARVVPRRENILAPHFVMYVKEILTEKYGERLVEQGGLKVITTLDFEKQKIAEEVIKEGVEKNAKYDAGNAALVAIDAKTGQVLAMVGSKDYFDLEHDGNVNVALRPRQPGSSFKPIVYATAFSRGYTPETILFDVKTVFKTETKDYIPQNYDGKEHGPVTMRQALAGSLNIPAVKTLYLAGVSNVLDLAEKLGYTTFGDRSRFGLSLVLGGGEVKLLEHTAAFGTFAREGITKPITAVLKIEDAKGKIIEEWQDNGGQRVLSEQVARQITSILSDNEARAFIFGTNSPLVLGDRPVAAKTGTTNDWRDGWTIGYTPSLVAGVWAGNNDNHKMKQRADGVYVAAPIWNAFMKKALEGTPVESFNPPAPSSATKPILNGKVEGETIVKIDKASGKLATEFTPPSFIEEKVFRDLHCILHYLNRDDPNGPPPADPNVDPQYKNWEEAVRQWADSQGYTSEKPPTEYDDLHIPENKPTIKIVSPENNTTLTNRNISVNIETNAPRGVKRVEYYLDDKLIKTVFSYPFNLNFKISNRVENGYHTLLAKAFDDIDNSNSASLDFNLLAPKLPPTVNWLAPKDNSSYPQAYFPLTLEVWTPEPEDIAELHFYYKQGENLNLIGLVTNITNESAMIKWTEAPPPGTYKLSIDIVAKDGTLYSGPEISVNIF